jgi:hypothetical protein
MSFNNKSHIPFDGFLKTEFFLRAAINVIGIPK